VLPQAAVAPLQQKGATWAPVKRNGIRMGGVIILQFVGGIYGKYMGNIWEIYGNYEIRWGKPNNPNTC